MNVQQCSSTVHWDDDEVELVVDGVEELNNDESWWDITQHPDPRAPEAIENLQSHKEGIWLRLDQLLERADHIGENTMAAGNSKRATKNKPGLAHRLKNRMYAFGRRMKKAIGNSKPGADNTSVQFNLFKSRLDTFDDKLTAMEKSKPDTDDDRLRIDDLEDTVDRIYDELDELKTEKSKADAMIASCVQTLAELIEMLRLCSSPTSVCEGHVIRSNELRQEAMPTPQLDDAQSAACFLPPSSARTAAVSYNTEATFLSSSNDDLTEELLPGGLGSSKNDGPGSNDANFALQKIGKRIRSTRWFTNKNCSFGVRSSSMPFPWSRLTTNSHTSLSLYRYKRSRPIVTEWLEAEGLSRSEEWILLMAL